MIDSGAVVYFLVLVALAALLIIGLILRRRIRSRRQLEQRVSELEALGRAGRALAEATLDPEALYELIYEQVGAVIDTCTFQLGIFDNGCYRIVVWVQEGERQEPAIFDLEDGEGVVGWVGRQKEPLLVDDFQTEWATLPARPRYVSKDPYRSALFIPLVTGDDCIGVLAAQNKTPGAFKKDDLRRLSIVANQAASAIANARLYQQAHKRAVQLELVSQVSRQVRALTPLDDLMQQTAALIQSTFGYYCVSIYGYGVDGDRLTLYASTIAPEFQDQLQPPPTGGLNSWAAARQETVLVNDVAADARYLSVPVLPDTRSEIVVPMMIEDQVIGTLDVQSDRANAFDAEDRFALEALVDQIALAVQESRLYQAERRQRSVAETLREVAQTLTSTLELETVLSAILSDLRRVLVYDAASILLLDSDDSVVVESVQGLSGATAAQGKRFDLADSARLTSLADSDRPIIFECSDPAGCYHQMLDLPPEHACLGAPLVARDELIGFVTVDALPPTTYGEEDIAVIAAFAGQAAVAIDNARLFASQKEEAWTASALLQMAESTSQFTELEDVLSTIVHMTVTFVGVKRCGILLWDEERNGFLGTQLASTSADPLLLEEFTHLYLPGDEWTTLASLKSRQQPVVLGGSEALSDLPDELFDFFGLDAWLLLLPLLAKGKLIGAMMVSAETSDVDLLRRRVRLISGIAYQAALAIENAQLYAVQQADAYVTIALLQVAEAVNSLTDIDEILSTIVRLSPMLTGVDQCAVLYWHPANGRYSLGPEYGLSSEQVDQFRASLNSSPVTNFLNALSLSDGPVSAGVDFSIGLPSAWEGIFDSAAVLALPLSTRRDVVGAMVVSCPGDGASLSARRQNILVGIAHQASTAIDNDQLYSEALERERMERELEVAREIQSSFLPDAQPEEPGWSVGAFWQAARQVGGDFYDFFDLGLAPEGGRQWGVVIADVADKGVPAALYMALSRTLIRTVGHSRIDPATSLERVNDLLLSDSRSDLFVTVIYAVWEPEKHRIRYTNAGHNPPLCVRADGRVEVLRENNIVLGVLPDVSMKELTLLLEPGEVMILYTDGITDAINGTENEFGLDRLEAVTYGSRHLTAPEIVQEIQNAVAEFVDQTPQFDDLTLVVIKRNES